MQRERTAGVMHPKFRPPKGAAGERAQLGNGHVPSIIADELKDAAAALTMQVCEIRDAKPAMVAELTTCRKLTAER